MPVNETARLARDFVARVLLVTPCLKASRARPLLIAIAAAVFVGLAGGAGAGEDPAETRPPGWLTRKVRAFLSDVEKDDKRGLRFGPFTPRIEVVSSGGGLAGTLHFWTPDIAGSGFDIHAAASYSVYHYQHYDVQLGMLPHTDDRMPPEERGIDALFPLSQLEKTASAPGFNLYASAQYRDYPREDFYGLGPSSLDGNHSDYRRKDGLYEGVVRFRTSRLSLMGRAGWLETSISAGRDSALPDASLTFDEERAPGLGQPTDFLHFSAGAWYEGRPDPANPHRGVSMGLAFSRFDDLRGRAFQFNRVAVDLREYIPLGSRRHVLALRQVGAFDRPDEGSRVPFYLQSTMGGGRFLGGFPSSRFRDENLVALVSEYRFELRPKVELALIYGAGHVAPSLGELSFQRMRHSYGVGLRLKSPQRVRLRIDVLRSVEGTHVQVKFGPSF